MHSGELRNFSRPGYKIMVSLLGKATFFRPEPWGQSPDSDGWMDAQEQALCSLLLLYPAWCFSFGRGPWLKTGEWDAGKKHLENIQTASQLYSAENITPPRVIGSKLNGTWKATKHAPCFLHLNQARDGNIQPSFGVGIWNRVSCG